MALEGPTSGAYCRLLPALNGVQPHDLAGWLRERKENDND